MQAFRAIDFIAHHPRATLRFARQRGVLAALERLFAPLAGIIGWHSDFAIERVLGDPRLTVTGATAVPPFGIFTFLVQRRT